ncbi:MAG: translation initiation factor IF-2 N-terminal domain-containing protein, partial [Nitratireductor sp.]|nr:translation initiation factor IF-2 N-terminal domain-containing protein [Nitratireductor sp.]
MSDKETDDKKLSVSPKKTLTLRPGGLSQGTVRQSFSHGRTKQVVVETRKRRINKPTDAKPAVAEQPVQQPAPKPAPTPVAKPVEPEAPHANLSQEEIEARRRALEEATARDAEDKKRRDEESNKRAEELAKRLAEREETERRRAEEEERRAAEEAEQQREEAAAARRGSEEAAAAPAREDAKAKELKPFERKRTVEPEKPARPKTGDDRRRTKLTLTNALDEDGNARGPSLAAMRRRQEKARRAAMQSGPREKIAREVILPETITLQELASRMSERSVDVIKYLMQQGQMMKPGDVIDADTAELIANDMGHTVKRVSEADVEVGLFTGEDGAAELKPRPPVVTIMG